MDVQLVLGQVTKLLS